jgi:hypothetical protein
MLPEIHFSCHGTNLYRGNKIVAALSLQVARAEIPPQQSAGENYKRTDDSDEHKRLVH